MSDYFDWSAGNNEDSSLSTLIPKSLTLALRVDRISENAQKAAEFLESHSKVKRVFYPGLSSHPQHKYAKQFMKQFSEMIAFDVGTAENDSGGDAAPTVAPGLLRFSVENENVSDIIEDLKASLNQL